MLYRRSWARFKGKNATQINRDVVYVSTITATQTTTIIGSSVHVDSGHMKIV